MKNTIIGPHLSNSKGFVNIIKEAKKINANTFQFFTRNPRGTKIKKVDLKDIEEFKNEWREKYNTPFVAHAPYTYNLCSKNPDLRELALKLMDEDIKRLDLIECPYYNFHPGSHTAQGTEKAIDQIIEALNILISNNQNSNVTLLLETMAGKGTEIGRTFNELQTIRNGINNKDRVKILLDTCHVFDGGYDIKDNLDNVLENFDKTIGINNLKAIHLNDSKNILNSHKDRHEQLGKGNIGLLAINKIISHPVLKNLPFLLETPNDLDGYKKEIELIREMKEI
ncbi:MAG: deoxyribonuclease IV [Pleomorphochaeta sp.]